MTDAKYSDPLGLARAIDRDAEQGAMTEVDVYALGEPDRAPAEPHKPRFTATLRLVEGAAIDVEDAPTGSGDVHVTVIDAGGTVVEFTLTAPERRNFDMAMHSAGTVNG
jgi:hypothetical protein